MKKNIMISWQLLKNSVVERIILFILMVMVSLFFGMAISLLTEFDRFFDEKASQLDAADFVIVLPENEFDPQYMNYLDTHDGVRKTFVEKTIILPATAVIYNESEVVSNILLFNDARFVENEISLPMLFDFAGGYDCGDEFTFAVNGIDQRFIIKEFVEDYYFGSVNFGILGMYISNEMYTSLSGVCVPANVIKVYAEDGVHPDSVMSDFMKEVAPGGGSGFSSLVWTYTISQAKAGRSLTSNITAIVLLAMSLVLWIVVLLVIKHGIDEEISRQKKSFAILYCLGYSHRRIRFIILLQYLMVCMPASLIGSLISPVFERPFRNAVSEQSGLLWSGELNILDNGFGFVVILVLCYGSVFFITRKIKRLPAIDVLQGRDHAQVFQYKKGIRDNTNRNTYLIRAFRVFNRRSFISLYAIIAIMTMACYFTGVLFYNICIDRTRFIGMVVPESFDLKIVMKDRADSEDILKGVSDIDGVSDAYLFDTTLIRFNGMDVRTFVSNDYKDDGNNICYAGKLPETEREIMLGGRIADSFRISLGDTISVSLNDHEESFVVCGFGQAANQAGRIAALTNKGMERLQGEPYYYVSLDVRTEKNASIERVKDNIYAYCGDKVDTIVLFQDLLDVQLSSYLYLIGLISIIMAVITAFVVSFSLFIVIDSFLRKRRYDFCIEKMIGFSNRDIIYQCYMSYIIPCGVILLSVGIVVMLFSNRAFSMMFSGIGIMRSDLIISVWVILLIGAVLLIYISIISLIILGKIKRINMIDVLRVDC